MCISLSKKIISTLLKPHKEFLAAREVSLKEGVVLSTISKAKAKGLSAADYLTEAQGRRKPSTDPNTHAATVSQDIDSIVAEIYVQYELTLRRNNSLDFDDLLIFGVRLFTEHHGAVSWCRHVLVDEL